MTRKSAIGVASCFGAALLMSGCQMSGSESGGAKAPDSGRSIEGTVWEMSSYISVSGTMDPRVENSMVNMKIADGKVTGNAGANKFFGGAEVDGSSIQFSPTGSGMMMGTPELMVQETQFLKLLQETTSYQIVGEELRLSNAEQNVVLVFVPRIEPTLSSNGWKATGINNGRGGVQSLLKDTAVTAQFSDDGRISGNAGCNTFSGDYEIDGDKLKVGPLAVTRRMCADPEGIMGKENNVLQALENAGTFRVNEDILELRDVSGALQVQFRIEN